MGVCTVLPVLKGAHVESKKSHWNLWWMLGKRDLDSMSSGGFVMSTFLGIYPPLRPEGSGQAVSGVSVAHQQSDNDLSHTEKIPRKTLQ